MTIDHIGIAVSNYEKSKKFYSRALAPLEIELVVEIKGWAGFGKDGKPKFWFGLDKEAHKPMHIAFSANTRKMVDLFYEASIEAGAKDNGKPGVRERYHSNYYGAFIIAPDGHNIEAVCHSAE
jgi:catechol 2,3-dioxygenase-like lactoylglutathione lyase family enzyme